MTNFRIILAYNGTAYHGWQRQNNALAVQQVLEEAILSLTGQTVTVNGCSRTDAGVHARRFCASFLIESTITCRGIVFGLNSKLPDDISVLECEKVPLDFHARYTGCTSLVAVFCLSSRSVASLIFCPLVVSSALSF